MLPQHARIPGDERVEVLAGGALGGARVHQHERDRDDQGEDEGDAAPDPRGMSSAHGRGRSDPAVGRAPSPGLAPRAALDGAVGRMGPVGPVPAQRDDPAVLPAPHRSPPRPHSAPGADFSRLRSMMLTPIAASVSTMMITATMMNASSHEVPDSVREKRMPGIIAVPIAAPTR